MSTRLKILFSIVTLAIGLAIVSGAAWAQAPMPEQKGVTPTPAASPSGFTCPYLVQKSLEANSPVVSCPEECPTVLEVLENLNWASDCLHKADDYRRDGNVDLATFFYEQARRLCPGSRLDTLATAWLTTLQNGQMQQVSLTGEEEQEADRETKSRAPEQFTAPSPFEEPTFEPGMSLVQTLIRKGEAALERGQLRDAQEYAELTRAIDPKFQEAQVLLERVHRLRQRD